MKRKPDSASLSFVSFAALVAGLDYSMDLFFPESRLLSLNRVVFPVILAGDFICYPQKYTRGFSICALGLLILFSCSPFLIFADEGATSFHSMGSEILKLCGIFMYLLFFYVNCNSERAVKRVCAVMFFGSGAVVFYVLCSHFEIIGARTYVWHANIEYTRSSGVFDPNIVTLYFLPCFAFGPLLALHSKAFAGFRRGLVLITSICVALFAALQLNSRAGSVAVAATLGTSLAFRSLLTAEDRKRRSRFYSVGFVALVGFALAGLQWKYGIFETIVAIYEATDILTDASFSFRMFAYRYLAQDLITSPNLVGNVEGYAEYWSLLGWTAYPHCSLADVYIKGGAVFLLAYLYLLGASTLNCLRGALKDPDPARRALFAGCLAYFAGLLPLIMTLSIDTSKLPWAVLGCALGFSAVAARQKVFNRNVLWETTRGPVIYAPSNRWHPHA